MNWLNLRTKIRTSPEFVGSDPTQRATWLCLMLYCAEHETGGIISSCLSWGNRRWMQTCGITKVESSAACDLWEFINDSLHVYGYPVDQELVVFAKREGGRRGGLVKPVQQKQAPNADVSTDASRSPSRSAYKVKERKGKEGKEKKDKSGELSVSLGEFKNVKLSKDEKAKLEKSYGAKFSDAVDALDSYIEQSGKKYKSHYAVMKSGGWVWTRVNESGGNNGKQSNRKGVASTHYQAPGKPYAKSF